MFRSYSWHLALVLLLTVDFASSGTAAFDLPGPQIEVRVTRAGKTLPISQVPNLQPGDRIWIHPKLPPEQSVHYLLIASFLRGVTNPPPATSFTKAIDPRKSAKLYCLRISSPSRCPTDRAFSGSRNGWGLYYLALRRPREARGFRQGVAGFEPGKSQPVAFRCIPK